MRTQEKILDEILRLPTASFMEYEDAEKGDPAFVSLKKGLIDKRKYLEKLLSNTSEEEEILKIHDAIIDLATDLEEGNVSNARKNAVSILKD